MLFECTRLFSQNNRLTGEIEWFFSSREGDIGPFYSKAQASYALREFVKFNAENNNLGDAVDRVPAEQVNPLHQKLRRLAYANGASEMELLPVHGFIDGSLFGKFGDKKN